jgi:glycosyltransferase involved in cell wall biosynthesis
VSARPHLLFVVESGSDARLVGGLAEGFELAVLARRIPGGVEISNLPPGAVALTVGPASRLGFAWLVLKTLLARGARPDFVLAQGYGPAALAANVVGRLRGLKTSMLVCSPSERYYRCRRAHPAPDKPFRRRELWALLLLARLNALVGGRYVVLSRHLAEVVRGHGARRVSVAPVYGVDTEVFAPNSEPKRATKERLGLPTTGSLIFFSSRVAPEKDAETLLEALRRLLGEGRDLWLLHRGGGHRAFLERAARFGVAARVVATDAVHPHGQLPDDYRAADLCVQASREEGLGFSPLEALACGTPVVASAVGGLRETILDGETGWTYPSGDASALARRIAEALDDPAESDARAARGRALVQTRYERRAAFAQLRAALACSESSEVDIPGGDELNSRGPANGVSAAPGKT